MWILLCSTAVGAAYPTKLSSTGRYLVDATGSPFLIVGDAPHSLLCTLNSSDAVTYLQARGLTNGVNTIWVELLCDSYTGGVGNEGDANYGRNLAGDNPFTSTLSGGKYDLTKSNEAYWSHVDFIIKAAATNGIQCLLTPLDEGGWTVTSQVNLTNGCYLYGRFLGTRYAGFTNIIWNLGNDFQNWNDADPSYNKLITSIAQGISDYDTNHLMTCQLNYYQSETLQNTLIAPLITLNGIYTYLPTYDETLIGYNHASNRIATLLLEEHYEDENIGGPTAENGTASVLRKQAYWSLLAGSLAGHMYGDHYIWGFISGWQSNLNTTGMRQLGYWRNVMTNRAWYSLVPDQSHTFVTSGYGTYTTNGTVSAAMYSTAAISPDGTLGIIYNPTNNSLTVDMSKFTNTVTIKYFDPTTNALTTIGSYPNTGTKTLTTTNNAEGTGDWVILFESSNPAADTNPVIRITFP